MKIAVAADLHFKGNKLAEKKAAWSQAVDQMIGRKVEEVIILGDTADRRQIGDRKAATGTIVNAFIEPANKLFQAGIFMVMLKGNGIHEGIGGEGEKSPIEVFGLHPCISTYETSQIGIAADRPESAYFYIPWLETEDQKEKLEENFRQFKRIDYPDNIYKLILGHANIKGAKLPGGMTAPEGEFTLTVEELEAAGADLAVFGHIHNRQWLSDKVCFVGALNQDSFGDEGNEQGWLLIDTEERTHEFIEIDSPRYFTLNGWDKMPKIMIKDCDYVKYRFKEKPDNYDKLIADPHIDIEIIPDREILTRKVAGIEAGKSDAELLTAYLGEKGAEKEAIERIVKTAGELAGVLR